MTKRIDEKAEAYANSAGSENIQKSDLGWYIGEVETAYTCGYMQAESDLIRKLWETDQFTMSKIAEMLNKRLIEIRNAINCTDWK